MLKVCRDVEFVNSIMNHPEVRPFIGPGPDVLDLAAFMAEPRNVVLATEDGCFLFHWYTTGVYEVHTNFLPQGRGRKSLAAAKAAAHWMFTQTDCTEILTKIIASNVAAVWLTEKMNFSHLFDSPREGWGDVRYYRMGFHDWVAADKSLPGRGHWFHSRLESERGAAPGHDDDAVHDRYVGATVEMILAGNVQKAQRLYNSWAMLAGYAQLQILSTNPLRLHIGDGEITVRDGTFFHR